MKKLLFFGDSITDADRDRNTDDLPFSRGRGYVFLLDGEFSQKYPIEYQLLNRGIGGNNVIDLYARAKKDCWNLKPDMLTITMGINDVCFEEYTKNPNGVEIDRFDAIYRMFLDDTIRYCGNIPCVLIQPFILTIRENDTLYKDFLIEAKKYAKVVEKIAKDYGCYTISMQETFEKWANKHGAKYVLYDGTHPNVAGAKLIANEWMKIFELIKAERKI
jgi:lysophospholipase L1-like esterase